MAGRIPKPHLSCVKERINVKHKVFLVVYSHYVTCQVMLIWGGKTGFLYKAFCALGLMWVKNRLNPTNCAFMNPLGSLIFGNSLKNTVCGYINDRLNISPENQKNSPNFC